MARDAVLDMILKSRASGKSDNFRDGKGIVVIEQCKYDDLNDGKTFIARVKFLHSESKGDLDPTTKQPVPPNAVGSKAGWVQKVQKFKSAPGNVKAFILQSLMLKEPTEADEMETQLKFAKDFSDGFLQIVGKEQMLRGFILRYSTYQQAVKNGANAGQIQTYVNWQGIGPAEAITLPDGTVLKGNNPEGVGERRAQLDKTDPITG